MFKGFLSLFDGCLKESYPFCKGCLKVLRLFTSVLKAVLSYPILKAFLRDSYPFQKAVLKESMRNLRVPILFLRPV